MTVLDIDDRALYHSLQTSITCLQKARRIDVSTEDADTLMDGVIADLEEWVQWLADNSVKRDKCP
jgi:hypothetical protein